VIVSGSVDSHRTGAVGRWPVNVVHFFQFPVGAVDSVDSRVVYILNTSQRLAHLGINTLTTVKS